MYKFKEYVKIATYFTSNSGIFVVSSVFYSTGCMFIYRFAHTTQSQYFEFVSSMRNYFICYLFFISSVIAFMFIPFNTQLLYGNELIERLKYIDPLTSLYIINRRSAAIGLNVGF